MNLMTNVYYGELPCEGHVKSTGKPCVNHAYYCDANGKHLCGVHSKKEARTELPKNPNKKQIEEMEEMHRKEKQEQMAQENRMNGRKGDVIVTKMHMMKSPVYVSGYVNVFPNFKHQNRKDGFGCARLSPKSLGPVEHGMPGIPPAGTIENYHQFAKFWEFELDEQGQIKEEYKQQRIAAYANGEPMRHKYDRKTIEESNKKSNINTNINIPLFSAYYDSNGVEHRYTYLQCRYFYCHFYELLAMKEPDFVKLMQMRQDGYNLNICGFDGYSVNSSLQEHFMDTTRPFGHELVLYTLLTEENPANFPWNVFYEENRGIYEGVI